MTGLEALNICERNGTLKVLIDRGFMSPKIIQYREIYMVVDKEVRINGKRKMSAYEEAAEIMRCDVSTVRNAVREMTRDC